MKKKVLFIDRDGTLIIEPPEDFQVDSLEKLTFFPKVIQSLGKITQEFTYELAMVTNQDGLGTPQFPEEQFWQPHRKMLQTFESEGITFEEVFIDRSFEEDNAPTRKPRLGMLGKYLDNPHYDLANSYIIGDRISDMELAYNLGAKGILIQDPSKEIYYPKPVVEEVVELITTDWEEIYQFLKVEEELYQSTQRSAKISRKTYETEINISLNLDGEGKYEHDTGIGFFDHMLDQLAKHAQLDLQIKVKGDLHIDEHHTIEDTAIALGEAFRKALGNKRGIERYGHFRLPMDESLAQVALDFSGRPWLVWKGNFKRERVGDFPTEMVHHFFKSFADNALCNLNIQFEGDNDHHQIEAIFKAFAKSIKMAIRKDQNSNELPSTKGIL